MMYRVLCEFFDLEDAQRHYRPGDEYPRAGYEPAPERIAVLSGSGNGLGRPVIGEAEKPAKPAGRRRGKA